MGDTVVRNFLAEKNYRHGLTCGCLTQHKCEQRAWTDPRKAQAASSGRRTARRPGLTAHRLEQQVTSPRAPARCTVRTTHRVRDGTSALRVTHLHTSGPLFSPRSSHNNFCSAGSLCRNSQRPISLADAQGRRELGLRPACPLRARALCWALSVCLCMAASPTALRQTHSWVPRSPAGPPRAQPGPVICKGRLLPGEEQDWQPMSLTPEATETWEFLDTAGHRSPPSSLTLRSPGPPAQPLTPHDVVLTGLSSGPPAEDRHLAENGPAHGVVLRQLGGPCRPGFLLLQLMTRGTAPEAGSRTTLQETPGSCGPKQNQEFP